MKRATLVNWLLGLGFIALVVVPLVFVKGEYVGADGEAMAIVEESHPDYRVWFSPLYQPPSEEVASGLFALQAALGAGALGYFIGRAHGRRSAQKMARQGDAARLEVIKETPDIGAGWIGAGVDAGESPATGAPESAR